MYLYWPGPGTLENFYSKLVEDDYIVWIWGQKMLRPLNKINNQDESIIQN